MCSLSNCVIFPLKLELDGREETEISMSWIAKKTFEAFGIQPPPSGKAIRIESMCQASSPDSWLMAHIALKCAWKRAS